MSNKKQTAVEWLEEKFKNSHANFINWSLENFEQAKEIEKQQIIDAVDWGLKYRASGFNPELYYNETFSNKSL
jgi:hypothetical protein